ncbi:hypothetical protein [Nocardia jejuensis]|uniref:hypothetical protein n=1 Tax=Nocardia jejuensis TaxID=328049 RepID=UPI0012F8A4CB|nr:hypothetical protein [Nocardia jejuensis]
MAPSAAAATQIDMSLEAPPPGGYVTGAEYHITSIPGQGGADSDNRVVFTDNGRCFAAYWRVGGKDSTGSSRVFPAVEKSVRWVPTTTGAHTIVATANEATATLTVNTVAPPVGAPPPPPDDPNANGCNDTGNPHAEKPGTGSF